MGYMEKERDWGMKGFAGATIKLSAVPVVHVNFGNRSVVTEIVGDDGEAEDNGGRGDAAVMGSEPLDGRGPGLIEGFHFGGVRQNLIKCELPLSL